MSDTLQGNGNHFQGESGGSTTKLILVIGKCNRGADYLEAYAVDVIGASLAYKHLVVCSPEFIRYRFH